MFSFQPYTNAFNPAYKKPKDMSQENEPEKASLHIDNANVNPHMYTDEDPFGIIFYQTKDTIDSDIELYTKFIKNVESRFRRSRVYKNYKAELMSLGLNRCQVLGNINSDMATIEMHHNVLTLFDIAFVISKHLLATKGYVNTFMLLKELRKVHTEHKVQLVMLSKTPHEYYHNGDEPILIDPRQCFGDWVTFLKEYHLGITKQIAYKIIKYLDPFITREKNGEEDKDFHYKCLEVRESIYNWAKYNEELNIQPRVNPSWVMPNTEWTK